MKTDRRASSRRKSDRHYKLGHPELQDDVINPLKMRLFLAIIFSIFIVISIFAPLWMFLAITFWLLIDYFTLLGGTLNWLNRKIDEDFKGTGFLRRILSTDARIILCTTTIAIMILIADYFHPTHTQVPQFQFQWSDACFSHSLHMIYMFSIYTELAMNSVPNDITYALVHHYIFIVMIRGLLIANLIHVIHHLLVNQHLAGVKFTTYPPLMNAVYKLVSWARK